MIERDAQIVLLLVQLGQPTLLLRASESALSARSAKWAACARSSPDGIAEQLEAVFAHRLEHPEARRREPTDRVAGGCGRRGRRGRPDPLRRCSARRRASSLRRRPRAWQGRRRSSGESSAALHVESVAQRLLPGREVARARGQHGQRSPSRSRSCRGVSSSQPGRGQLDRERQAVETLADRANVVGDVRVGASEASAARARARRARRRRPHREAGRERRARPRRGGLAGSSRRSSAAVPHRAASRSGSLASMTCSKLSRTSRSSRSAAHCAMAAASDSPGFQRLREHARSAGSTSSGALRGASSTKAMPSANRPWQSAARANATRVFPVPPAPTSERSRTSGR